MALTRKEIQARIRAAREHNQRVIRELNAERRAREFPPLRDFNPNPRNDTTHYEDNWGDGR